MENVKEIYRKHYNEYNELPGGRNKFEWAASNVFELATYDSEMDEIFVKDIFEVCSIILNKENYQYIEYFDNYKKYLAVCQLLTRYGWIDWGTSIRGAWFDDVWFNGVGHPILEEYNWSSLDDYNELVDHVIPEVKFSVGNLKALIEFVLDSEETESTEDVDFKEVNNFVEKWREKE